MVKPAGRRKVRKRKAKSENSGVKLSAIAVIMLVAVFLGFLTARFVIGPVIGYNADESEIKLAEEDKNAQTDEDVSEIKETTDVSAAPSEGYALQFGAFSTKEAAQSLADILNSKGIKTEIVEIDSVFKVISPVIDNKDDAVSALNDIKDKDVTDVFIASFQ
ncbi:MAG: SPOR domain-containing protein [Firmicutes bacterium]|nr:SPOR domain-containing protein [Bacillota bacterium]